MTLSKMTLSIKTLSIGGLYVTLSISDNQHKLHSIAMLCHCAECHYGQYHILFNVMLNVIMTSVVMLSFVAPFITLPLKVVLRQTSKLAN
jgi:hypothetical protein